MTSRIPRPDHPPIVSAADLRAHWQTLMGTGGYDKRSLWLIWLDDDGRSLPAIVPIDDIPSRIDEVFVTNLIGILADTIGSSTAGSAAILLSRPGPGPASAEDIACARSLVQRARQTGVVLRPMHLATSDGVTQISPDELAATG